MKTTKKLVFCLLFGAFLVFLPTARASADGDRYFIKTTSGFWKNALGVRHNFDNGFTTDASDFQLGLARVFGVEIERVPLLQILPDEVISSAKLEPNSSPVSSVIPFPELAKIITPKAIKNGGTTRYLPSDQTPWGIETIYNDTNIETTSGGFGINVAILDTGVLKSHPDLAKRIAQCKDFTNARYPIVDGKCDDKNGHGTHVAGIIAADAGADSRGIYGVASQANLFIYKVCGTNGSCYADDIATAIRMAASDKGAKVINMSFGSDRESSLIRDAVSYAASRGVLMVAAAGNDGPFVDSIDYPAAYASVVAVGAINKSLNVTDWSARGNNLLTITDPEIVDDHDIEFAAPGDYIESTWNNGGYAILSGTSMASPFVAGLAAKFWKTASTSADSLVLTRDFLHSLAIDLPPSGNDDDSGFGLPQVK